MNTRPPGPIPGVLTQFMTLPTTSAQAAGAAVHSTRASVQTVATSSLLSRERGDRPRDGRAGWGHMVGRKAEKSRVRGVGRVHGARAVMGSGWPGYFCLSWG